MCSNYPYARFLGVNRFKGSRLSLRRKAISTAAKIAAVVVIVAIAAGGYAYYGLSQPPAQPTTLLMYGSTATTDMQPLIRAFKGNYSYITVNYQEFAPPALFTRVTSEINANKSTADMIFVTNSLIYALNTAKIFVSYNSSQLSNYPKSYYDPGGHWAAAIFLPVVFSYNTQLLSKSNLPQTINDLTNPSLRGKVIMHDITIGSTGTQYMLALQGAIGNQTWTTFVQQLLTNVRPTLSASVSDVTGKVASGEYSIGIISYLHDVVKQSQQGAPISYFLPQGVPILTTPSSIGIVKGTHSLRAAQLFEDFILSKGGQQILGNTPVRIPALPGTNAKYTLEKLLPNVQIVFFPTPQIAAQASSQGQKFKQLGY